MKQRFIYFLAILLAICLFLCASTPASKAIPENGYATARATGKTERFVSDFTAISYSGSIPITYIQSKTTKVVIEGNPQLFDYLQTDVRGRYLYISMKRGNYRNLNLSLTVYSPVLEEVSMSGSGPFYDKEGHISDGDIYYHSAGSGKFEVGAVECRSFNCSLSGSGNIKVDRLVCEDASLSTSGSGGITVRTIITKGNARLRLAGSGFGLLDDAKISGELSLSISGSGSIRVNGHANSVNASISGSGSIIGDLEYNKVNMHTSGSGRIRL